MVGVLGLVALLFGTWYMTRVRYFRCTLLMFLMAMLAIILEIDHDSLLLGLTERNWRVKLVFVDSSCSASSGLGALDILMINDTIRKIFFETERRSGGSVDVLAMHTDSPSRYSW